MALEKLPHQVRCGPWSLRTGVGQGAELRFAINRLRNMTDSPTHIMLVGGFLGAGKTTLLWTAAQRLTAGHCLANLTGLEEPIRLRGAIEGTAPKARLVLNARVEMPPEDLEKTAREALATVPGQRFTVRTQDAFALRPGRPCPTYRYDSIPDRSGDP